MGRCLGSVVGHFRDIFRQNNQRQIEDRERKNNEKLSAACSYAQPVLMTLAACGGWTPAKSQ